MTVGDEKVRLCAAEMILVPALAPHDLANAGPTSCAPAPSSPSPRSSPRSTISSLLWRAGY
jgi:hypothetical protein